MGFLSRVKAAYRAFVLGKAVVDESTMAFGVDNSLFSPPEYGNYIATSNGVYVCATLRADLLSSVDLQYFKVASNGDETQVFDSPIDNLLSNVNPYWTFPKLIKFTEQCLGIWGVAYWFLERGPTGLAEPSEIWWARPDRVILHPDPQKYIAEYTYRSPHGTDITYKASEVIRFANPNIIDEFNGLAPLAAARLAADYAQAGMKSNKALFEQGLQTGGFISPPPGKTFSKEQAKELETSIKRRFMGGDKAHKWGIFPFQADLHEMGVTPKDAEFLEGLKWSLEDIARAYKVPLDLVGGERTYENVEAAYKAIWTNTIIPEGNFISAELVEQLLPMFKGKQITKIAYDYSVVPSLQEDINEAWTRTKEQIEVGATTVNEWRLSQGKEEVAWGDVWWGTLTHTPISDTTPPLIPVSQDTITDPRVFSRAVVYGSDEHEQLFARFVARTEPLENRVTRLVTGLFEDQQKDVIKKLNSEGVEATISEPFDLTKWRKTFREDYRPVLTGIVVDSGNMALNDLEEDRAIRQTPVPAVTEFDPTRPAVVQFIEDRNQRFAVEINETTWDELVDSLTEGLLLGESIEEFNARVIAVMGDRIRSTPTTISRTEVVGANNGGTLLAWVQSEIVANKKWIATLDTATRASHIAAHNAPPIPLTDNFTVGAGSGPHPGGTGVASEDINCRCSMVAELTRMLPANFMRSLEEISSALERLQ